MSIFSSYIRGFDEEKFWKYYKRSQSKNAFVKLINEALYMRMASKQGGYIGRGVVFNGKPHFPHGLHGVHITRMAIIGENAIVFQNVTIGQGNGGAPRIGNNFFCGANAVIIGPVTIGDNVSVGAGAIVVEDVPDNTTMVGPKAHAIKKGEIKS